MLPEFNKKGLKILATIAREIAILEGQDTLKNYAGTKRSSDTKLLVERALFLVKAAGGANTLTTRAVREGYFAKTKDNVNYYYSTSSVTFRLLLVLESKKASPSRSKNFYLSYFTLSNSIMFKWVKLTKERQSK